MFDKFAKQDNERETASRPVVDVFQRAEDEAPGDEKMDEKDSTGTGDNKDGSESEKAPPDSTRSEDSSLAETTSVENVTSVEESVWESYKEAFAAPPAPPPPRHTHRERHRYTYTQF